MVCIWYFLCYMIMFDYFFKFVSTKITSCLLCSIKKLKVDKEKKFVISFQKKKILCLKGTHWFCNPLQINLYYMCTEWRNRSDTSFSSHTCSRGLNELNKSEFDLCSPWIKFVLRLNQYELRINRYRTELNLRTFHE